MWLAYLFGGWCGVSFDKSLLNSGQYKLWSRYRTSWSD